MGYHCASRPRALKELLQFAAARGRQIINDMVPRRGEYFTPAYAAHLAQRLPLLYTVGLIGVVVLSISFVGLAPGWLTLGVPPLLCACMGWRAIYWLPRNVARRGPAQLERDVSNIGVIGPAGAFVLVVWALALEPYGDINLRWLVHYVTAVTCLSAILGLGQSPITALRIALCVMAPSMLYLIGDGHPYAYSVVAIEVMVTILLLMVAMSYHRDFVNLELSRQQVMVREQEARRTATASQLQATVDSLTGVLNRRAIVARLEAMLADPCVTSPWLGLVDLDGFKYINDTYGHAAGDAVLCAVASRIAAVPEIEALGRLGGDEFAVLLSGSLKRAEVIAAIEDVAASIREPIVYGPQRLKVACSIGLRRTPQEGGTVPMCMERADAALYNAKQRRCGIVEFTAEDEQGMQERRAITRVFHSADLPNQISVVYQPIVDSDTERTLGFEALSRWSPDGKTWLLPGRFVELAEATGRIGELTRTVLHKALGECRAWEYGRTLSINLSARDILSDGAAEWIGREVEAARAPPEAIILEITETALLSDYERAASNLHALRALGFRIALDDFGTGQSSLSHVYKLPLDHLKIDQSFARNLATDPAAQAITGTVLTLARQLGIECTIEGIETQEQRIAARGLGLRLMQGYLFGRPMPVGKALGLLEHAA